MFDGSLGCVQEIREHHHGDKEAVYEDISEHDVSTGYNHSNNLHDTFYQLFVGDVL